MHKKNMLKITRITQNITKFPDTFLCENKHFPVNTQMY